MLKPHTGLFIFTWLFYAFSIAWSNAAIKSHKFKAAIKSDQLKTNPLKFEIWIWQCTENHVQCKYFKDLWSVYLCIFETK